MPADSPTPTDPTTSALLTDAVDQHLEDLIALRRDLHAHPELSWRETRTTALVADAVERMGWQVTRLPRTGLVADLGDTGPIVALRADLDALPVPDLTDDPWVSTVEGVAHACGHDIHITAVLGAARALAAVHAAGRLPGRVRLLFQPAEEVMPGGALTLLEFGALSGVSRVFGLHCDPSLDVGHIGLREGPITGAADHLQVELSGSGGHTSRPHLTEDLTFALGKVVTELPAILSRRLDPRAGVSVVWGVLQAGSAHNVVPSTGWLGGTVRMLDAIAWSEAEKLVPVLIEQIVAPYGVRADVDYRRGVPPVVNEARSIALLSSGTGTVLGAGGAVVTQQSLGGEDFGWYLDHLPGAMMRLGTRTPGGPTYDLHQGDLRVDERAVAIGAKILAHTACSALADLA
ncbi:amidohydrolase [Nocardioides sp. zg-DK7169]|uniref:amidohydrolase n=1 Tax=Nocardioides sp. zg-DK7169 TaxID=2736600 RepID=UPI00155627A0|nr:amidohydrolase [Nocardioides sp. zg-DK7169]NPC99055.1 amidohydrolase [Nocardioides sp. zg-DK7169]